MRARHADYADPASLPAAFDGADQLLVVSSSDHREPRSVRDVLAAGPSPH